MSKKKINPIRGFTLIELLVAISIVGFLSTLAVVSLKNAREKARDANRLADLRQIKNAMEMYYNDFRGFPSAEHNGKIGVGGSLDVLLKSYLTTMPRDPLGATDSPVNSVHYYYYDAGQPCNGGEYANATLIFASAMEKTAGNAAQLCTTPWSGTEIASEGSANAYHVLVGQGQ